MSVRFDKDAGKLIEDRELRDAGSSTVLTLPKDILEHAELETGDIVEVSSDWETTGEIVLSKADNDDE